MSGDISQGGYLLENKSGFWSDQERYDDDDDEDKDKIQYQVLRLGESLVQVRKLA